MSNSNTQVVVYVTYQGTPEARFDRGYYVATHLPLVLNAWGQYGLESIAAFYPAVEQTGTVCICECRFRDEAALQAALNSPEAPAVMADVAKFTDLEPVQVRVA
ncbi:EthD family reductase [Pseudomonas sp. NPDC007930]|uniref:EthD family reductase n=1 Tax=Pseudomonas sp. NPDC007930 TaxID=3364417 RepID=UPI0036EB70A3